MKLKTVLALGGVMVLLEGVAFALPIFINFDTDAYGNPITVPGLFTQTTLLTELYAPLGVHFAGPSPGQGGAILNAAIGSWNVSALSGPNILGFNSKDTYAFQPETITFDTLMTSVSIFAADADATTAATFTVQAYGAGAVLLDSDSINIPGPSSGFSRLIVSSSSGIDQVVLSETGGYAFEFDNLSASPVPEPSALALIGLGASLVGYASRSRTAKS